MDTPTRSLVKAGSWRVIASSTTVGLIYLFTGQLILAMTLGVLELVLKLTFYWLHERAWQRVDWGNQESTGPPTDPVTTAGWSRRGVGSTAVLSRPSSPRSGP